MLELRHLESFFPEPLRHFKRNILREYLQYKILEIIYGGRFGLKLVFMGGTAIHIVHGASRFSEDLDFDNQGMTHAGFRALARAVERRLELEGFRVTTKVTGERTFRADIRITGLLFELGLSGHKEEVVSVKIDAEPQEFDYAPERIVINKFDVTAGIRVVPPDIILAQKFYAILKRKRAMGRDFYDVLFLLGKPVVPNFSYLKAKAGIGDMEGLKKAVGDHCARLDFAQLARDTEPLIFRPQDAGKISMFPDVIADLHE